MSGAPLPEVKGSFLAAAIEVQRAFAHSTKAASKERRREKKLAKARRKAEERRRDVMQQQELPVQQPKAKQARRAPKTESLTTAQQERLLALVNTVGLKTLAEWWVTNQGWSRPSTEDREAAARKLIGMHASEAGKTTWKPVIRDLLRLLAAFRGQATSVSAIEVHREEPQQSDAEARLAKLEANFVRLMGMLEKQADAALAPKPADVDERLRLWESVKKCVVGACKDDRKYKARWMLLRSKFEVENYDLKDRAREIGIDPDSDDWMRKLVIKQPVEFVQSLLAIAKREFPTDSSTRTATNR